MLTDNLTVPGTDERAMMLRTAVAYMRQLRERRDTYERECDLYARQGYRPHYCIHGTNQWTDYDNICGPCEEGYTDREQAMIWAHDDVRVWIKRFDAALDFLNTGRGLGRMPQALVNETFTWANEPLDILTRYKRPVRNLP